MAAETSPARVWITRGFNLELGKRTLLMGVVNVTPDSFSDGGKYDSPDTALSHALKLQNDGADLLDIGAESTRPGSSPAPADVQLNRLLPVFERLREQITVPISVDTTSSVVAKECLRLGASIVNDTSGFHFDPELPSVCKEYEAGVVLMHIKGTPRVMQQEPPYVDLFGEIRSYLREGLSVAGKAGISQNYIVVDPGIGFGKTFEENYRLLDGLFHFSDLAAGILVGPSRKAFTGEYSQLPPEQRQFSTAAAVAIATLKGADVIRVHDVREMRQVVDILDKYRAISDAQNHGHSDR